MTVAPVPVAPARLTNVSPRPTRYILYVVGRSWRGGASMVAPHHTTITPAVSRRCCPQPETDVAPALGRTGALVRRVVRAPKTPTVHQLRSVLVIARRRR